MKAELSLSGGEFTEGTMGERGESMESAGNGLFAAVAFAGKKRGAEVRSDVTNLAVKPYYRGALACEEGCIIPEYAVAVPQ